jgi:hypothetical protein
VSAPLAKELAGKPHVEVLSDPRPLPFDEFGTLNQEELFPECVRAVRKRHGH